MLSLNKQVAGEHYKSMAIQPMEYSMLNNLDACQHTAIKYITRFRAKNGLEDLDKAIHCIEMLKEFYKNEQPDVSGEEFHEEFLAATSEG